MHCFTASILKKCNICFFSPAGQQSALPRWCVGGHRLDISLLLDQRFCGNLHFLPYITILLVLCFYFVHTRATSHRFVLWQVCRCGVPTALVIDGGGRAEKLQRCEQIPNVYKLQTSVEYKWDVVGGTRSVGFMQIACTNSAEQQLSGEWYASIIAELQLICSTPSIMIQCSWEKSENCFIT